MLHMGDIMLHCGGYHEYIGDMQYIGDIMMYAGDIS